MGLASLGLCRVGSRCSPSKVFTLGSPRCFYGGYLAPGLIHLDKQEDTGYGKYRLRACAGWYSVLRGESNVAIVPAIGGYGAGDIYLGEFSPQAPSPSQDMFLRFRASFRASGSAT